MRVSGFECDLEPGRGKEGASHRHSLPSLPPGSHVGCAGCAAWFVRAHSQDKRTFGRLIGRNCI